jgi:prepilin-type N-terminal cleavage/methylation domain-containing protein
MNNRGVTLIELIIVVSIIAILIVALGFSFQGWMGKYRAESQVKELYVDQMNARARAMQHNRMHFVSLTANSYAVYEDTNPGPDGNQALNTAQDYRVVQKNLEMAYTIDMAALTAGNPLAFMGNGMLRATDVGIIKLSYPSVVDDVDYDCINLSEQTRINLGKMNGANCEPK